MADLLFSKVADLERQGASFALCTVVRATGSVPRHAGSKMIVFPDGSIDGSIGGGEMESRVIATARQSLASGEPQMLSYTLSDPSQGDPGVCGGEVEVFVEPIGTRPTLEIGRA